MREDRSVMDLLTADYTFVNERLARHYGIPNVYGSQFRRVTLTSDDRRGLLGQGSILTVTSYPNRTSPVQRGKWILTNLLGIPPTPPPPNVPALKENGDGKPLSLRERMEQHRADAVCAGCHKVMDPIGFALENFDARRAVAHRGRRLADRSLRHALQRDEGRRPGGAAQDAGRPSGGIRRRDDRKAVDLRAGPRRSSITICRRCARSCSDAGAHDFRFSSLVLGTGGERAVRNEDQDGCAGAG